MKNLVSILRMFSPKGLAISAFAVSLLAFGGCSSDDDEPVKTDPDVEEVGKENADTDADDGTISEKVFKEKVMNRLWVRTTDESFVLEDGSERPYVPWTGEDSQSCNAIMFGEGSCTRYFPHSIILSSVLDHIFGQYDFEYEYDASEAKIYLTDPGDGSKDLWFRIESVDDESIVFHREFGREYIDENTLERFNSPGNYHKIRYRLATEEDIAKFSTWQKSEYWY